MSHNILMHVTIFCIACLFPFHEVCSQINRSASDTAHAVSSSNRRSQHGATKEDNLHYKTLEELNDRIVKLEETVRRMQVPGDSLKNGNDT